MRTTTRRLIGFVILAALAVIIYRSAVFIDTFELFGLPVRSDANGWLGPTPRDRSCVVDIGKVHNWKCEDTAVFQRHRLGSRLWLRLNGLTASEGRGSVPTREWALLRSVSNGPPDTLDFVVVPEHRRNDRSNYETIANEICGSRTTCTVKFWTDRRHVPTSAWMSGEGLTEMTASYERFPTYPEPVLRLACWLYATQAEAENAGCFYLPGANVPWRK